MSLFHPFKKEIQMFDDLFTKIKGKKRYIPLARKMELLGYWEGLMNNATRENGGPLWPEDARKLDDIRAIIAHYPEDTEA